VTTVKGTSGSASATVPVATGAVTGTIVEETKGAVYDEVTDPATGETTSRLVSAPVYAPVTASVVAYGPRGHGRGSAKVLACVDTSSDGTFSIGGLTTNVYLEVIPSKDWQAGWLWVEYLSSDPQIASYLQRSAPEVFDVAPTMDVGLIQLQTARAHGRVVDAVTGAPIARARVRYEPVAGGHTAYSALTDEDGEYDLRGLDYEEYAVHASAHGYVGGYLGDQNLLYATFGEAATWPMGPLPGDVIRMAPS
jgi:Carboxypeptidase regulatory-like domain